MRTRSLCLTRWEMGRMTSRVRYVDDPGSASHTRYTEPEISRIGRVHKHWTLRILKARGGGGGGHLGRVNSCAVDSDVSVDTDSPPGGYAQMFRLSVACVEGQRAELS